jgi:hypothetical protein
LLSVLLIIKELYEGIPVERLCLDIYGDTYPGYMDRTPRWIRIPEQRKRAERKRIKG